MNILFQTIGTLFQFNLGLTSALASYQNLNVIIGTRHLLLYTYGIQYTRNYKNLKILLTTFPTSIPYRYTLLFGVAVAHLLARSSLYRTFISKFDVAHLNDREHTFTKAIVKFKKATLLTLHWLPSKIDENTFSRIGIIVAPSEYAAKVTNEVLGIQPKVIYHGVDASFFNTGITKTDARKHLGLSTSRKIVLWNGRLDPIKDPKTLIEAIPLVAKEIPDSLFVIKGRGTRSSIFRFANKYLKSTGTEQNVRWRTGWEFFTEMPYYYRSADVCVHTSLSECCSLVLIEAMACGVPVVVTDIPAVYDPVGNAGLHFEPKNSDDLADRIVRILQDEKLRIELQEKGLRRVSELGLTWENASECYRDLYLSLI